MVDFDKMKEKHPRGMMILQGLWIVILSTILVYVFFAPFLLFGVDVQVLIDIFTFPTDIIPQPFNLIGLLLLPIGMFLVIWANYALLGIGKIGLKDREPMQRPSKLVRVGPYRFTRNPIYLGNIMMLIGLVIVWSSVLIAILTGLVYFIFRYVFIKKEEIILEEEFGEEYLEFKRHVNRWL